MMPVASGMGSHLHRHGFFRPNPNQRCGWQPVPWHCQCFLKCQHHRVGPGPAIGNLVTDGLGAGSPGVAPSRL